MKTESRSGLFAVKVKIRKPFRITIPSFLEIMQSLHENSWKGKSQKLILVLEYSLIIWMDLISNHQVMFIWDQSLWWRLMWRIKLMIRNLGKLQLTVWTSAVTNLSLSWKGAKKTKSSLQSSLFWRYMSRKISQTFFART